MAEQLGEWLVVGDVEVFSYPFIMACSHLVNARMSVERTSKYWKRSWRTLSTMMEKLSLMGTRTPKSNIICASPFGNAI
jgi:hypothetical protein